MPPHSTPAGRPPKPGSSPRWKPTTWPAPTSLALHGAPFWDDLAFACLNCGTCTFSCPTCWCFDIQDEVHGTSGVRMKNWDSCMFPIFTVHTTGHNPRGTKTQRVRQRFMHKLKYFVDKYETGIMCVGCGRCVRPVSGQHRHPPGMRTDEQLPTGRRLRRAKFIEGGIRGKSIFTLSGPHR
jgi:ferredoxin